MKLQGMAIVFALICLPIILVLSYYISLQVNTLNLQNQYDSKLLDATSDALSSFEINTANEDLSTVSDSLRTIVEASNNVFINTLATNFGMSNASKSMIEPYIPAILYTLYDGYYIYGPTYTTTVLTDSDGNAVYVGDPGVTEVRAGVYEYNEPDSDDTDVNNIMNYSELTNKEDYGQLLFVADSTNDSSLAGCYVTSTAVGDAEYSTQNILKTYIPYSARYVQEMSDPQNPELKYKGDINVIYTLDNYVTIDAAFEYNDGTTIYYTKSGYLIPFVNDNTVSDDVRYPVRVYLGGSTDYTETFKYSQEDVKTYIEQGGSVEVKIATTTNYDSDGNITGYSDFETVINIVDTNKAIIDTTNTNKSSDTVILTRYNNLLTGAEECLAQVNKGAILPGEDSNYTLGDIEYLSSMFSNSDVLDDSIFDGLEATYGDGTTTQTKEELIAYLNDILEILQSNINTRTYNVQLNSAAVYYAQAIIFSQWVAENLSELDSSYIKEISGLNYSTYQEELMRTASGTSDNYNTHYDLTQAGLVFDFSGGSTDAGAAEINEDSSYYNLKLNIIMYSIQYNLNLSMSAYNRHLYYNDDDASFQASEYTEYSMPIMQQSEWEQILSNVSIVAFMQGMSCGLKTYSNYMVVSSTNNELMTNVEDIYYVKVDEFNDESSSYHKIDCGDIDTNGEFIAFSSKDVKYDKSSNSSDIYPYVYDHKNLACYSCINDGNYTSTNFLEINDLRSAYYIGIGSIRNDTYKMNAVSVSQGYEIIYDRENDGNITDSNTSKLTFDKIKSVEIVFGAVDADRNDETSATFSVDYNGTELKAQTLYSIPTNNTNYYTWVVEVDPLTNLATVLNANNLGFANVNDTVSSVTDTTLKNAIKYIRVIYK